MTSILIIYHVYAFRLTQGSMVAERDIVQFVPFRQFVSFAYKILIHTCMYGCGPHISLPAPFLISIIHIKISKRFYKKLKLGIEMWSLWILLLWIVLPWTLLLWILLFVIEW